MQSGARYQAVLELLEEIFKDERPADGIIGDYLRARKYIGAKDRRFISETVWHIIRNRMKLTFDAESSEPRKILLIYAKDRLTEVFDGSKYGIAPLSAEEEKWLEIPRETPYPDYVEAECPQWLFVKLKNVALCKALNVPAPADFRVHGHERGEVLRRLENEGIGMVPTVYSPYGLRSGERLNLNNCAAYQDGWLEVQDEASQLAAVLCDVKPGQKIVDYCCGAGGKSLALSHILQNKGHILAHDVSLKRLEAIKPRLERLGVKNIELTDIVADSDKDFDRFVLDVPCSGTGTWRRSPDGKFRLTPEKLAGLKHTQEKLLETAASKVKAGGRIIYITCSLLPEEDEEQIDRFLLRHPEFQSVDLRRLWESLLSLPYPHRSEKYLKMSPLSTGSDGFFVSVLEKNSL